MRTTTPTTTPARRRWRLLGTPMAVALALGAGGVLTACEPVPSCFGRTPTITGTAGNDVLDGTAGNDVIVGLGGNDVIAGFGGADVICGGAGADRIDGGAGADTLDGSAGSDRLRGSTENDRIHDTSTSSGDVNDMVGAAGDDQFQGGAGRDRVDYSNSLASGVEVDLVKGTSIGEGSDRLRGIEAVVGSPNSDTLWGDGRSNALDGRGHDDWVDGRGGDDNLIGGAGRDWVGFDEVPGPVSVDLAQGRATGQGADRLTGFENIKGSRAGDVLTGNPGDNVIDGFEGVDTCLGGGGNDSLICP